MVKQWSPNKKAKQQNQNDKRVELRIVAGVTRLEQSIHTTSSAKVHDGTKLFQGVLKNDTTANTKTRSAVAKHMRSCKRVHMSFRLSLQENCPEQSTHRQSLNRAASPVL